jgi:hypothetical protein
MHPGKLAVLALLALAALAGCDESGPATGTFGGTGGGPGPAPSTLAIDTSSIPPAEHGVFYSAQFQASGGSGGYDWHFGYLPQPFTIPVSTGAVATIEGTPGYAGDCVFEVYVTDSLGAIAHASINLHVGIGALVNPVIVTTTSMPDATVGVPYNLQLNATGGAGGYTWSNLYAVDGRGILPGGQIHGTPTTPGERVWLTAAVDSNQQIGLRQFRIRVRPAAGALRVTAHPGYPGYDTGPALIVYVNEFQIKHFRALGGRGAGHKWSVTGTLPPGLGLVAHGGDCFLAGVCNVQGTWNLTMRVEDSSGASHSWAISLVVSPPPEAPIPLGP